MILKGKFGYGESGGIAWLAPQSAPRAPERGGKQSFTDLKTLFHDLEKKLKSEKKKLTRGDEFLDFPIAVLNDPELWREIEMGMKIGKSSRAAVEETFLTWEDKFQRLDDPYLRLRGADLADLRRRVLSMLAGKSAPETPREPFVAVAADLFVTDLLEWHRAPLRGICLEEGNESAHGVLLARALGIPVAGGVTGLLKRCKSGDAVAIRGRSVYLNERGASLVASRAGRNAAAAPAVFATRSGAEVAVRANVQLPEEIAKAKAAGAKGVGLFRTEFLWISGTPSLADETKAYRDAILAFKPDPVVFRLADLGSDKPFHGAKWPEEKNPALGWRGMRFLLDNGKVLKRQLEALFRASRGESLHILLPMVRTAEEIEAFLRIAAPYEKKYGAKAKIGIMVETPSAVYLLEKLQKRVSFVSLGTNDLLQYFFAVDRLHPKMKADPLHPLFIRLLKEIVQKASGAGKSVSICGEIAADPKVLPVLLRLGLREFSVSVSKIPAVAKALRNIPI